MRCRTPEELISTQHARRNPVNQIRYPGGTRRLPLPGDAARGEATRAPLRPGAAARRADQWAIFLAHVRCRETVAIHCRSCGIACHGSHQRYGLAEAAASPRAAR